MAHTQDYYMGLRDDTDDRWLRERASKKRKEIIPPLLSHHNRQTVGHFHGREREREREAKPVIEQICQFLASMTDCAATGALITIKGAPSHTLFLHPCLLSTTQGGLDAQTHEHTQTHRGEALISSRKEYNEWVIKTQGRIAANLCPLSEHRSCDKRRISDRQWRQASCAHWGDEIGSISSATQCRAWCTDPPHPTPPKNPP